jgi:hypothetical protein
VPRRHAANGHRFPIVKRLRLRLERFCDIERCARQNVLGPAELGAATMALCFRYVLAGAQMAALRQQLATATQAYTAAVGVGGGCGSPPVSGLTPDELSTLLTAVDAL